MVTTSAGVLPYRTSATGLEVWLAHMGGPFWAKKDEGAWSIVKGEYGEDEAPLDAALREYKEELGVEPPAGPFEALGEFRQNSAKRITVFAVPDDGSVALVESNTFELEWPPRSGRRQSFPEVDRAQWFSLDEARRLIVAGQRPVLESLETRVGPIPAG
jgi:predicted NUDIX family NTP pyrophosphohydrolase